MTFKLELLHQLVEEASMLDNERMFSEAALLDRYLAKIVKSAAEGIPDPNTSLLGPNVQHGKRPTPTDRLMKHFQDSPSGGITPIPKAKPEARERRTRRQIGKKTMRDAINVFNRIMIDKGYGEYAHGKELVGGKGWGELNEKVSKHMGLQAGKDYKNWRQMIAAMQHKAKDLSVAGQAQSLAEPTRGGGRVQQLIDYLAKSVSQRGNLHGIGGQKKLQEYHSRAVKEGYKGTVSDFLMAITQKAKVQASRPLSPAAPMVPNQPVGQLAKLRPQVSPAAPMVPNTPMTGGKTLR